MRVFPGVGLLVVNRGAPTFGNALTPGPGGRARGNAGVADFFPGTDAGR